MSASAFRTVAEEINRQRQTTAQLSRSASIGIDMTPSSLNPIRDGQRRALYGSLPFFSAFGMTQRENEIRNVLSSVSRKSLQNLAQASEVIGSAPLLTSLIFPSLFIFPMTHSMQQV
jgi:hypothetical protein